MDSRSCYKMLSCYCFHSKNIDLYDRHAAKKWITTVYNHKYDLRVSSVSTLSQGKGINITARFISYYYFNCLMDAP